MNNLLLGLGFQHVDLGTVAQTYIHNRHRIPSSSITTEKSGTWENVYVSLSLILIPWDEKYIKRLLSCDDTQDAD